LNQIDIDGITSQGDTKEKISKGKAIAFDIIQKGENNILESDFISELMKKMSKSSPDEKSKINLNDTPAAARKKIMSATTDSVGCVNFDWATQPGVTNLLQLLAILTNRPQDEVNTEWVGQTQYGALKTAAADAVVAFLEQFHARYEAISDDELLIRKALYDDSEGPYTKIAYFEPHFNSNKLMFTIIITIGKLRKL
jgi:tryptophanyl-tRNA synthetase